MNPTIINLGAGAVVAYIIWQIIKEVRNGGGGSGHDRVAEKFIDVYREEGRLMRHELRNIAQVAINALKEK